MAQLAAADAPTLLDALARAPAAAALVVGALDRLEDRALRLAHPQLRDAVGEATTNLEAGFEAAAAAARPPTPWRWPRLEELHIRGPDSAALKALGSGVWGRLRRLGLGAYTAHTALNVPSARALAAALRRMPALRELFLWRVELSDAAAAELFGAWSAEAVPKLCILSLLCTGLTPAAARALATTG
jgi:hypothetical protein